MQRPLLFHSFKFAVYSQLAVYYSQTLMILPRLKVSQDNLDHLSLICKLIDLDVHDPIDHMFIRT